MDIVKIFSALLAPAIAGIAVYIAWQQRLIASNKLKLDLYDRRFKIYSTVNEYLLELTIISSKALQESAPIIGYYNYVEFNLKTKEAAFLFDVDIINYIAEIRNKAELLIKVYNALRDHVSYPMYTNERNAKITELRELSEWLQSEVSSLENYFEGYLGFKHLK